MISNHCEKYELKRVKTFWLPKIKFHPNISKQNSYSLLVTGYIDTNFPDYKSFLCFCYTHSKMV